MAPPSHRYSELKEDALSDQSSAYDGQAIGTRRQWTTARWIIVLVASLISTNILTMIITSNVAHSHHKAAFVPPYGIPPFFNNISLDLQPQRIYAPLYDRDHSLYRKHESPETEVAWRELTQLDSGLLLLPKEQAAQVGIDPTRHAYWNNPEKGLVGHPVRLEATHQLHCLNLLRRFSYFHYNYTNEYDAPLKDVPYHYRRIHADHCVDYLRNRLMCLSDMGLIPYFWLGRDGDLVGDMSRTFTCRNYESVRQFVKAKAEPADGRVKPEAGDYVLYDYI
ncbi:hypothetical protein B0T26DRAFT_673540 [Lasiosphaeria miniovina]|uniref:Uncharacterized protein n=1 Tax=Lasiosphaeria miniovina TaxID=1954250 RepID=A0AA40ATR0_9PEZI|nr:uncharacterized protein B0T26DRAFT_673540 [Lasiosphaeria miniovina]KAK0721752.1 hypothetical protein B0T26DRAFT_673540 [Lasiosphaeria miniovina]